MLTSLSSRSSFDESVGEVSSSCGVLVEEDLDDSASPVELETMRMSVDEGVEDVGGGVLGDHPEGRKEESGDDQTRPGRDENKGEED